MQLVQLSMEWYFGLGFICLLWTRYYSHLRYTAHLLSDMPDYIIARTHEDQSLHRICGALFHASVTVRYLPRASGQACCTRAVLSGAVLASMATLVLRGSTSVAYPAYIRCRRLACTWRLAGWLFLPEAPNPVSNVDGRPSLSGSPTARNASFATCWLSGVCSASNGMLTQHERHCMATPSPSPWTVRPALLGQSWMLRLTSSGFDVAQGCVLSLSLSLFSARVKKIGS